MALFAHRFTDVLIAPLKATVERNVWPNTPKQTRITRWQVFFIALSTNSRLKMS
jgi:hypothetical protein